MGYIYNNKNNSNKNNSNNNNSNNIYIYIYTYGSYIDNIWIKLVDFTMKYMKCGDLIIKVSQTQPKNGVKFGDSEASPVGDDWQPSAAQEERHVDFFWERSISKPCRTPANDR